MYDVKAIVETLLPQLLRYPNPTDPLNPEAAMLMTRTPERYRALIQRDIERHATEEVANAVLGRPLSSRRPVLSCPDPSTDGAEDTSVEAAAAAAGGGGARAAEDSDDIAGRGGAHSRGGDTTVSVSDAAMDDDEDAAPEASAAAAGGGGAAPIVDATDEFDDILDSLSDVSDLSNL
jgi:hypothetical protein